MENNSPNSLTEHLFDLGRTMGEVIKAQVLSTASDSCIDCGAVTNGARRCESCEAEYSEWLYDEQRANESDYREGL